MYRVGRTRLYISIIAILLLESNLLHFMSINNIRPDLILVFVIFVGLYSDWRETLEAGVVGGLLRGALTTSSVGINLTILCLCGLFATQCKNKVYKESFLTQIALTLLIAFIFNLLNLFTGSLVKSAELIDVGIQRAFISTALLVSLYTSVIAPPAFFCLRRLLRVRMQEF